MNIKPVTKKRRLESKDPSTQIVVKEDEDLMRGFNPDFVRPNSIRKKQEINPPSKNYKLFDLDTIPVEPLDSWLSVSFEAWYVSKGRLLEEGSDRDLKLMQAFMADLQKVIDNFNKSNK